MKSPRKISSPFLAMMVAGVGIGGLIVWWFLGDHSVGRPDDRGGIAPADSSGVTQAAATPPWASEEQKATAAEREAMRRKKFELYAELTKGLPELQPKLEGIPEFEVNGYERLVALARAREENLPEVPGEFMEMLEGKRPWDGQAVQGYLKQHAELLAELEAISLLPVGEVDWKNGGHFPAVAPIATMGNILCLSALDAAHNGSPIDALDFFGVLNRIARHLRSAEDVDGIIHSLGMQLQSRFQRTAPLVAKLDVNSPIMSEVLDMDLQGHRSVPEDVARYWRGDTVSTALIMMLPTALRDPKSVEPLNLEELKGLLRLKFERNVRELKVMREASNFTDLKARLDKLATTEAGPSGFSSDAQKFYQVMCWDPQILASAFVSVETRRQLALAAVRLARDDAAPETILAEIAASEPEPRKLHYDPATRTLTSEPFLTETEKTTIQVP